MTSETQVASSITELELARLLPELDESETANPVDAEPGTIENFMDESIVDGVTVRRVMRIVADAEGSLRKQVAPGFD